MSPPDSGLRVAWLVLPRSGSQFLVQLTAALLGPAINPHSSLTPGRREKALPGLLSDAEREHRFRQAAAAGTPERYFDELGVRSVKIEHPFGDDLPGRLRLRHPACRFIASIRPYRQIADSHANLSWGFSAERLLAIYRSHVAGLIAFAAREEVFFVDIERHSPFDAAGFAAWLDAPERPNFRRMVEGWPTVNARAERIARDGGRADAAEQPSAALLAEGAELDERLRALAAESHARLKARLNPG
ncbi:hypothetical protein [Sediminicoccus sp. KRV36]|uniref:hypothetical protein n=1 Tax=Sediminicoccus sp. KRV36 TaxID=3133721 RepID=UPI00200D9747|nr:hypothetical protein [Sediminicoccus rosea]UPY36104.1 hypothetical protein LHU95_18080 [Sediminicoccus rosea]